MAVTGVVRRDIHVEHPGGDRLVAELNDLNSADQVATWGLQALAAKNTLLPGDAERVESAFQLQLSKLASEAAAGSAAKRSRLQLRDKKRSRTGVNKTVLTLPTARRIRDRDHVKSVAKQPCLICDRRPADAHHLRFAQSPALGRKVSDEFTVPLCRGHHREVHRFGDEAAWWRNIGILYALEMLDRRKPQERSRCSRSLFLA